MRNSSMDIWLGIFCFSAHSVCEASSSYCLVCLTAFFAPALNCWEPQLSFVTWQSTWIILYHVHLFVTDILWCLRSGAVALGQHQASSFSCCLIDICCVVSDVWEEEGVCYGQQHFKCQTICSSRCVCIVKHGNNFPIEVNVWSKEVQY